MYVLLIFSLFLNIVFKNFYNIRAKVLYTDRPAEMLLYKTFIYCISLSDLTVTKKSLILDKKNGPFFKWTVMDITL